MEIKSQYQTNGNEAINNLLFTIEILDCFSEKLKKEIVTLCINIVENGGSQGDEIRKKINILVDTFKFMNIFNSEFILKLATGLQLGLQYELGRSKQETV